MNWGKLHKQGFILLEAIILIGILSILFILIMPSYAQYLEKTRENVCYKNCWNLDKLYEAELVMQNKEHSEDVFKAFLMEQSRTCCPDKGKVEYVEGTVVCATHPKNTQR